MKNCFQPQKWALQDDSAALLLRLKIVSIIPDYSLTISKKKSRAVTGIVPAPRSIPNFFVWLYLSCVLHPKIDIAGFLRGCELPLPDFFVDWLWVSCSCWHGGPVPLTPLFRHHSNPLLALEQRPVAHCAETYGARLFWGRGRHNLLDDLDLKP